jgi:hypothetical protein
LWQFDLFGKAEPIQLTEYHADDEGHYDWHTDVGANKTSLQKISITVQVSDPDESEGGELQFMSRRVPSIATTDAGNSCLTQNSISWLCKFIQQFRLPIISPHQVLSVAKASASSFDCNHLICTASFSGSHLLFLLREDHPVNLAT